MNLTNFAKAGSARWVPNGINIMEEGVTPFFYGKQEIIEGMEEAVMRQAMAVRKIPYLKKLYYSPDMHVGIGTSIGTIAGWRAGQAMISPSIVGVDIGCGMSLMMTDKMAEDVADKEVLRKLMQSTEEFIPAGEGKKSAMPVDEWMYQRALQGEYLFGEDIDKGRFEPLIWVKSLANEFLSEKAYSRGLNTMGTLGGGNHFLEYQRLAVIDWEMCDAWGLVDGGLAVMVHTGSRGLGHQVGEEYIKSIGDAMREWGVKSDEPGLVWAPFQSDIGYEYWRCMAAAANGSKLNRAVIRWHLRQVLDKHLGASAQLVYDVCHNYADIEVHDNEQYLVHRKGATRALPAGHFTLKGTPYFETGHPVLIPGAMGRPSYVLVGLPQNAETMHSVNHGAGRVMSRTAATKNLDNDEIQAALGDLLINSRTIEGVKDEAPQAYKDIDLIIESVVEAGLAKVVAKLDAMACIKGVEQRSRR